MRYLILFFCLCVMVAASEVSSVPRGDFFNDDWRFAFGENASAKDPDFDDTNWDHVGIPHSFSRPFFMTKHFYVGAGWYRKTFDLNLDAEKLYWLYFEAVFQNCEIFINGKFAGAHQGGYTGFEINLTPHLVDGKNVVAVCVDNFWDAQLPPRAGEHTFSGGIYRDVYFVTTPNIFIPRNGLRVHCENITADSAEVIIDYAIHKRTDQAVDLPLIFTLSSNDFHEKITVPLPIKFDAKAKALYARQTLTIKNPQLWSPDSPSLYWATLEVGDYKVSTRFGIREFRFDKDDGFFLNGKHLRLRGANRHQDHAGWGDAMTNSAHYRDAKMIKDCGMNFVRGSHYPHDPAFLDACDELGLLVWAENSFWGIGGFGGEGFWTASAYPPHEKDQAGFEGSDYSLLMEMILEQFNHASIMVWSLCNEAFFTEKSTLEKVKAHLARQYELAKDLDPTRAVGIGGAQRHGFDQFGDVIGYNGDGAKFPQPDRPSLVAEYGSFVAERPGIYAPTWGEVDGNFPAWRAGVALWCAFHHASIAGDMGKMGMIDYARLPLRQWFWYRNEYAKIPPPTWAQNGVAHKIKINVDKNNLRADGTDDVFCHLQIVDADGKVIRDSRDVTLAIISGGGELPTGKSITFKHNTPIDIREGEAATTLRAWHNGEIILRATAENLLSDEITITAHGAKKNWSPELSAIWQKPRPFNPQGNFANVANNANNANTNNANVARNHANETRDNLAYMRPTRVSSNDQDSLAMYANDGDEKTFWQAKDGFGIAFWRVDLENFYLVEKIELVITSHAAYIIETSLDDTQWEKVGEKNAELDFDKNTPRVHLLSPIRARFVRVSFPPTMPPQHPARIDEIKISGKPAE